MLNLFRLFCVPLFKQWAYFIGGSVAAVLTLSLFVAVYEPLLILPFYFGLVLAFWQMNRPIGANLNWLMALPISKRGLLTFKYFFSVFVLWVFALSLLIIITSVALIKVGPDQTMRSFQKLLLWSTMEKPNLFLRKNEVLGATFFIIFIAFLHGMCLNLVNWATLGRVQMSFWNHANPKIRHGVRCGILGLILLPFMAHRYSGSRFGQVFLMCALLMLIPAQNAAISLSMSKTQRNFLLGASFALSGILVGLLYEVNRYS